MPRFFVPSDSIKENTVEITGDDARHISRSLRMAAGEHITVCDMRSNEYECVLSRFTDNSVEATVISQRKNDTEPSFRVHLYQALPKGDKLETIVQKSVECGVYEITPFESERCITRIKKENIEKKTERLTKISHEAAKQCGRGILPKINAPVSFRDAVEGAKLADIPIFCYEGDGTRSLKSILSEKKQGSSPLTISAVIGSEGGFSREEALFALESGMILAGLGKRILRCETAPIFVLGCIAYEFDL